ncbi:hypothetical protein AWC38_SpisGene9524 [Stylophora pistillata]|uniref:Uncharacterized protein n=1 Tax=Stylophora pistillata TaxID=50429 RepID=A0A2B4S9V2_STYPI|nr:hypothetical protein AWC38_SpisGene9524 [Stylophora pistillata]
MVLSSSRKMNTFVILAFLTVALLTDHSHGIMGWFGNGGKRPDGRRSLITQEERWNPVGTNPPIHRLHKRGHERPKLEKQRRHYLTVLREKLNNNIGQ